MAARELLEPGKSVLLRVEAELDGEEVKLRLQNVEALDEAAKTIVQGVQIFVRDAVAISLGQNFVVTPQIRGALKATNGVVDVVEL
jgi:DNA polymerase III subunit alpha